MRFCSYILILFFLFSEVFSQTTFDQNSTYKTLSSMTLEELMNIEIYTASKDYELLKDIPASVVLISRDDIKNHGYQTLAEILQNVPGLYGIDDYAEGGMNFGIRGFWSGVPNNNIIIMINNVPQTKNVQSSHPMSQIAIPIEAIDRIEIIRGPMSVIYGSGAFFGAINIFTKDVSENRNIISTTLGTEKTKKIFFRLNSKINDIHVSLNASVYNTTGIDQPASKMMSNPKFLENFNQDEFYTTGGSLSKNHKFVNLSVEYKNFKFDANINSSKEGVQFNMPSFGDGHIVEYDDFNFSLQYSKYIFEYFSIDFRTTYLNDRLFEDYNFLFEDFYGIQQLQSSAYEFQLDFNYKYKDNIKLKSGFYYKNIFDISNMYHLPSFNDTFFNNNFISTKDNESILSKAFYTQMYINLSSKFSVIAGFRIENSPSYNLVGNYSQGTTDHKKIINSSADVELKFIPRIAFVYNFNLTNTIKVLYGKAINTPSFFQNHIELTSPIDIKLKPEEIETLEINYLTSISRNYSINFSLFHNSLDNLITRVITLDETGNYESSFNDNAGKMITNGLELTIKCKPTKRFSAEFSASYQKTKNKMKDHEIIKVGYSPEFISLFKINYKPIANLTIAANAVYVSEMEPYWDNSPNPDTDFYSPIGRIGKPAPKYFSFGLNFRFENLLIEKSFISLKINNLFDEDIYFPATSNNNWLDKGTMDYGRMIYLNIGYEF